MANIIADSNILIASFLPEDQFHGQALPYVDRLDNGEDVFHIPTLVPVEVISAIWRRSQKLGMAFVTRARRSFDEWEAAGKIVLYPLDSERMAISMDTAVKYRLSGSDSVIVALAEQLDMPVKTFDQGIQQRFSRASP